jgi:CheY-like chemotaxis protein
MKILIVDDNQDNRSVLKIFLEIYYSGASDLLIDEVENGRDAVIKCQNNPYDIVFMDIEMPIMNGIEATQIIRKQNDKIIIIAVSADDDEGKRAILDKGAEDYIQKPIDYDIFTTRLNSYTALFEHRGIQKHHSSKKNLFTDQIFRRHTKFIIDDEDGLSEFWEFFLLNARAKYQNLSDLVRTLFAIADIQLKLATKCNIYIEENEKTQYFTVMNINHLPSNMLKLILAKNKPNCTYKIDDDCICFELEKRFSEQQQIELQALEDSVTTPPVKDIPLAFFNDYSEKPVSILKSSEALTVFDYIVEDDLYDLEEYASKLSSLMLVVGGGDLQTDEVLEMNAYLDKISNILSSYSEVYSISVAIRQLSNDLSTHINEFMENSEALGPLCKAFSLDLMKWIDMSFHSGAPSIDFMNDTIMVNCQTIVSMLHVNDATTGEMDDLDDIFDF